MNNFVLEFLHNQNLNAILIPTEDPHLSEYPADHWKLREAISGFTGSNGFLVVTPTESALWTDSRYFLQAEKQLAGSGIRLFKEGVDATTWQEWLVNTLPANATIGLDGVLFSVSNVLDIINWGNSHGFEILTDCKIPIEMPPLPDGPLFIHDIQYCGKSFAEKKEAIFQKCDSRYLLLGSLDEIAWTFNIRSNDTLYNPICISYAIIGREESYIAIDNRKLTDEVRSYFQENNIICLFSYESIFETLPQIAKKGSIALDPDTINYNLYKTLKQNEVQFIHSPIPLLKSVKCSTELKNISHAALKDGVALTKAFYEIEKRMDQGIRTSEMDVADILKKHRSQQESFFCESFATIAAYGANGAIVHYSATEESNTLLGKDNLLLVDSGANYLDGTTDITRVFCYGNPSAQHMDDYTLVLKGHIAIAQCKFPYGTEGPHIDALAHQYLWSKGLDYGHGTGHGIGFFLCVHEGPQRINRKFTGVKLEENMLLSDEPGLYRTGSHGIRIENMVTVQPFTTTEFGRFLQFETVTLFPYEPKLINKELLTQEELCWINQYHSKVYEKLSPYLNEEEQLWLKNVTKEL